MRKIGREAEYPVVDETGAGFDIAPLWKRLARRDEHGPSMSQVLGADGRLVGLKCPRFEFAAEVGLGTIEVITGPRHDLVQLCRDHEAAVARLLEATAEHGAIVLGLGCQPLTPPSEAWMTPKPRYGLLLDRIGPPWLSFGVTASDQVHIDISEPEIAAMTNLGNILSPVFIALCGNSPVIAGEDTGLVSWREHAMGAIDPGDGRHGMPLQPVLNLSDHIARVCALPHYLHKVDGVAQVATGVFDDFLRSVDELDTDAAFKAFLVQDHYIWHSARPRSGHGTVELRAACQQPWGEHMAVSALALGVIAGGADIAVFLADVLGPAAWDRMMTWHAQVVQHGLRAPEPVEGLIAGVLDRAKAALRVRGRREAVYLDPMYRRLANGESPADGARRAWAQGGMAGLIAHSRLPSE
jgi:gamma-glutamylcysteine synthetase